MISTPTEKARISIVTIGHIEVEGIMLPNGEFGITVQQTRKLLPLRLAKTMPQGR